MDIKEYIKENLPKTVRYQPTDDGPLFALPKPFTVPCADGMFQEMYYWDSYFTNIGLIDDGNIEQAKNNVEDIASMVERFGFVLNGSRQEFLNNSQPPFLSQMTREVYEATEDLEWLARIYPSVVKEYHFWVTDRICENGLCRYDTQMPLPEWQIKRGKDLLAERLGYTPDLDDYALARGLFSVGESGWDITPRFSYRTYDYTPVDLNSLLYSMEINLANFAGLLNKPDEKEMWEGYASARASAMREYLLGEDGIFYDYDLKYGKRHTLFNAACFYPLYFGLATAGEAEALVSKLGEIEAEWGILACVESDVRGNFQWGYPNGWPSMQQMAVGALLRYGYKTDALRIAEKYVNLVERCFEQTGHLWEKYNVVEGNANAASEYGTPAMLGWTWGVYRHFLKLLGRE